MASKRASRISDLDAKYFKEIFNLNGEVRDGHTDKRIDRHTGPIQNFRYGWIRAELKAEAYTSNFSRTGIHLI